MNTWISVAVAIVVGVLIGVIGSRIVQRVLGAPSQPEPVRQAAKALASLALSLGVIGGLITALGIVDEAARTQLGRDVVAFVPKLISAAIIVIAANVASSFATTSLSTALARLPHALQRQIQTAVRVTIVALATLLAIGQLGINTDVVNLGVAAVFFGIAASMTLLVGLGGREVAKEVASTRAVKRLVAIGDTVTIGSHHGTVTSVLPTTIELDSEHGVVLVPSSEFLNQSITVERAQPDSSGPEADGDSSAPATS
jgi:small-conductance mechanosensitive channel